MDAYIITGNAQNWVNTRLNQHFLKRWKELYTGANSDSEYFATDAMRMANEAAERGLLVEFVIREKVRPYGLFEDKDRTWISEEVAAELDMHSYWFGIVKKPELSIEKFERILLLDNYHEAGALGTVIRTARCFGFDGIMLTGGSVNPWSMPVTRSGQYNQLDLPILSLPFADAVRMLREQDVTLVTVGKRKAVPVEQIPVSDRMAILLSGTDASSPFLTAVSDIVCDPALDCSDPTVMGEAAAILMYACRNLKGE